MDLRVFKEIDELLIALAEEIKNAAQKAIAARGRFNFVLSGGSSPRRLYELLAAESFKSSIEWDKTYFFFGDERFVAWDDPQRNSLMAKEVLFDPLKIADTHVFTVDTTGSASEAARLYSDAIESHFRHQQVCFDFILLGLGDNSHTASLFPFTPVLDETEATIKSVFVKDINKHRITMTAPLINQAREIAFLVFGNDKAEAVYQVLQNDSGSPQHYPAKLIAPGEGELRWFLDEKAGALLSGIPPAFDGSV